MGSVSQELSDSAMSSISNNSFDVKYAPKSLDEVVFENDEVQRELQRYVAGKTMKPIIFHGDYGVGKTTMATLLITAMCGMETVRDARKHIDGEFIGPYRGLSAVKIIKHVTETLPYPPWLLPFRYFIFDELDLLGPKVISSVKSLLDLGRDRAMFIATTNHFSKLDGGHKSRSTCFHIAPAPLDRWKPRVEHILDAEGIPVPEDEALEDMLKLSKGDHRQFLSELQRYTEDMRRQVAAE